MHAGRVGLRLEEETVRETVRIPTLAWVKGSRLPAVGVRGPSQEEYSIQEYKIVF